MNEKTRTTHYDVGGILLDRPFRILRLGHFGFNVRNQETALCFYSDLLGLPVTDTRDFGGRALSDNVEGKDPNGYFLRIGADHHSVVLFPHWAMAASSAAKHDGTEWISHMAWQVSTLREVIEGRQWLIEKQVPIARPGGRDARGANWNFTVVDADFISNEIYYGMDQIGWDGISKPLPICPEGDPLPRLGGVAEADYPMVRKAIDGGLDLRAGQHQRPFGDPRYDVAGVMLPRPFRVVRNGPIRLFAHDVEAAARFYAGTMGLTVTEDIRWQGHRAVFLRANTEHHTIALYPRALCDELGLRPDSICMAYGMQVGSYHQLKAALAFLKGNSVTIKYLPPELFPGIDYSAFAIDPDGNAIHLYYYMEQIGWDGRPRPAEARRKIDNAHWPESLPALSDSYRGAVFQGPLG